MIDADTKSKLLSELEKSGNAYLACTKTAIARATYYRWLKDDPPFRKLANKAMRVGRENLCDIAEHALLLKVKEKDMGAIKYALSHNSVRYKPKRQKVVIEHISNSGADKGLPEETLTDMIKKALNTSKNSS
jgi:hypothetical protein